ncbi:MAG: hypothetical protein II456_00690 [Firmicutes bacterium]|nr:hypothetical protein [Bacillota bacterium]
MTKKLVQQPSAAATTRKRIQRGLVVLLCVVFAVLPLAGCGGHQAQVSTDEQTLTVRADTDQTFNETIRIGVSKDTPDVTALLEALPDTYTVKKYKSEESLRKALAEDRVRMAVLTPGGAAKGYKEAHSTRLVSPVYLGGYRLVGNKNYLKIEDPYRPQPAGSSTTDNSTQEPADSTAASTDTAQTDGTTQTDGAAQTEETSQQEVSTKTTVTVPHDPVQAGEISKKNILPSQLRSGRINVWHDTDTLIDLAITLGHMDGMKEDPVVIRRYEEETPSDYLTEYNHYALTNIRTSYGGQKAFTKLSELLDVDAYWEAMTGMPLPSAVLVADSELLERAEEKEIDALAIFERDFGAALESVEKKGADSGIVFYGSSNRGDSIMRTYYMQVYTSTDQESLIPDDAFYLVK